VGQAGILEHLLYCTACDARMSHTYTSKGPCRYRYYVCSRAQKQGWETCPSKSIPAEEIERFVWGELADDPRVAGRLEGCEGLGTSERAEHLAGLVERVEYDVREGDLLIHLLGDQKGTV
jgi:hypothetical protein